MRVKRTRVLENISDILTVSSPFTLFHYVLNKIFYNGKAFIGVLELSGAPTTYLDLDRVRLTLLLICQQKDSFLERALRIKPNNIIAFFLFFFARFYLQFNAEFPRQVMNFPIKLWIFYLQLVPGSVPGAFGFT